MLSEWERERLLVLKSRINRLVATSDKDREIELVVDWTISDWQVEINALEREDRQ